MSLVVPEVGQVVMLDAIVNDTLTLKLYSNNRTPALSDTAGSYTEVSGGGYADIDLLPAGWNTAGGEPGEAEYNVAQDFNFTGATSAPSTIYGYYVVNSDGVLMWAERFSADSIPFVPESGSLIRITPRFTLGNA